MRGSGGKRPTTSEPASTAGAATATPRAGTIAGSGLARSRSWGKRSDKRDDPVQTTRDYIREHGDAGSGLVAEA